MADKLTMGERITRVETQLEGYNGKFDTLIADVKDIHNTLHVNGFIDKVNKNSEYIIHQQKQRDKWGWTIRAAMVSAGVGGLGYIIQLLAHIV